MLSVLTCMMQRPIILFLSGWAGSGKDAAAALLVEEMQFHRLAFADTLKEDVAAVTGIPLATFHSAKKNQTLETPCSQYPTARTYRDLLLQHAIAVRAHNPDTFARHVGDHIQGLLPMQPRIVISDWRFPNEYAHIRERFVTQAVLVCVCIERPGIVPSTDPSEHYLDTTLMDWVITNDGSISDLRDSVKRMVHAFMPTTLMQLGQGQYEPTMVRRYLHSPVAHADQTNETEQ